MYVVKALDGSIINEYSADSIKPGRIMFTRDLTIKILSRIGDEVVFLMQDGRYSASLGKCLHKYIFFDIYDSNLKYYDNDGFDQDGYNAEGFDKSGFDRCGYDKEGYNFEGFDIDGYNREGRDRYNRDREGYDVTGFNPEGLDRNGISWRIRAKEIPDGEKKKLYHYLCTNNGIELRCKECDKAFLVSFETISFLKEKGYVIPKRCKKCREKRKKYIKSKGKDFGLNDSMVRGNLIKPPTGREQHYRFYGPEQY